MTKGFVFTFVCFGLIASHFRYHLAAVICDLKPRGATGSPSANGNKYRIVIATNPETYIPGQTYNGKRECVLQLPISQYLQRFERSLLQGPNVAGHVIGIFISDRSFKELKL